MRRAWTSPDPDWSTRPQHLGRPLRPLHPLHDALSLVATGGVLLALLARETAQATQVAELAASMLFSLPMAAALALPVVMGSALTRTTGDAWWFGQACALAVLAVGMATWAIGDASTYHAWAWLQVLGGIAAFIGSWLQWAQRRRGRARRPA